MSTDTVWLYMYMYRNLLNTKHCQIVKRWLDLPSVSPLSSGSKTVIPWRVLRESGFSKLSDLLFFLTCVSISSPTPMGRWFSATLVLDVGGVRGWKSYSWVSWEQCFLFNAIITEFTGKTTITNCNEKTQWGHSELSSTFNAAFFCFYDCVFRNSCLHSKSQ